MLKQVPKRIKEGVIVAAIVAGILVAAVMAEPNDLNLEISGTYTETFKTIDSTTLEVTIKYSRLKKDIEAEKTALLALIATEKTRIDNRYQPELDRLNNQLAEF